MIQLDNFQPIEIEYDTKYMIESYDCLAPAGMLYVLFETSIHRTCMSVFVVAVVVMKRCFNMQTIAYVFPLIWV